MTSMEKATMLKTYNNDHPPDSGKSPKGNGNQSKREIEYTFAAVTRKSGEVDSGWAWVVLASSFLSMMLIGALMSVVGVIHIYLLDSFGDDETKTAWVGSICLGLQCLMGPVASWVSNKWSCRTCTMIGGLVGAASLAVSSMATALWMSFLTYGIITGMGIGMVLSPTYTIVGYSFEQYRSFASAICVLGVAFGIMGGPVVLTNLEGAYGWRGAILLFAGILLNFCVLSCLQRPSPRETEKWNNCQSKTFSRLACTDMANCFSIKSDDLLRNKAFVCLTIAFLLSNFGISIIYLHLAKYVLEMGATVAEMQSIYVLMGVGNMISKPLTGISSGNAKEGISLDKMSMLFGAYCIIGTSLSILPSVADSQVGRLVCFFLVSFYYNVEPPLYVPISLDIVDLKDLNRAIGFQQFAIGIGFVAGPPFAAWLRFISQDYKYSFYLAGLSFFLGAVFCLMSVLGRIRGKKAQDCMELKSMT